MPDIVNTEQAQAWNGPEGAHWARNQDRWNAVNEGFDEPLLDAAGITGEDRVLDLGCGSGQTTRRAALRAPRGHVLGLDLSGPMLAEARSRAEREGVANVSFAQGDAQVHPFGAGAFDAAVSRYGVMFFADPVAAFGNIGRALRPGGRLAFVCPADAALNGWVTAMASLREALPVGDFDSPGCPACSPWPPRTASATSSPRRVSPASTSTKSRPTGRGGGTPRTRRSSSWARAPAATSWNGPTRPRGPAPAAS